MNEIKKEIKKEEVYKLPLFSFSGKINLISSAQAAIKAEKYFRDEKVYGVDTETKPVFKKGVFHPVSLLQLATSDQVFIFRLLRTGLPDYIISILEDKEVIKAGIDLNRDIYELKDYSDFVPNSVVDLNIMAKDMGFKSVGAKKLTALLFGNRISKSQQTSNWETAVLSKKQIIYAATDAFIARKIYVKLKELESSSYF
ncbi:MAG: 3'-5' exonuclease domain-containing protein 2 [Bacteroidetes bacterium]|nr:3'-5' exonuclease domain-containing protein 2 [Bacteroidota bacterium]